MKGVFFNKLINHHRKVGENKDGIGAFSLGIHIRDLLSTNNQASDIGTQLAQSNIRSLA